MKLSGHFIQISALLIIVFCGMATTCDDGISKFVETTTVTISPENLTNTNGRLEFSVNTAYSTETIQKIDSLEFRYYLKNQQIETLLGVAVDKDLKETPRQKSIDKSFKTTWFSKVPITDIQLQAVFYKKGKSRQGPRVSIGEIVSKPK
jgi:hypothetical protein